MEPWTATRTTRRNLLTITYVSDPDGTGKMTVSAAANGFAGNSSAWFNNNAVLDFAREIASYPLPEGSKLEITGGFGSRANPHAVAEEHVGLRVGPVGIKGQIGIHVHLATPTWEGMRPESAHDVRLQLLTTYQRLEHFGEHLSRVVRGELSVATIGGEVLI